MNSLRLIQLVSIAALIIVLAPSRPASAADDYHDPVGKRIEVNLEDLPKVARGRMVMNFPKETARPAGAGVMVPEGFKVGVYLEGDLTEPRNIQFAPGGDGFLVDSGTGKVHVVRDADGDGVAEFRSTFAEGFKRPFGVAFTEGWVYIGATNEVVRFAYQPGDTSASGAPEVIVPDLPWKGQNNHWTRNVVFNPDASKLYVSVGSASNLKEEPAPRASIIEVNPDGSGYRLYATGLRNPVGLAWVPETNRLWTTVNERDLLGDDLVPDYITSVEDGGFYGWPYFYLGANADPRMKGKGADRADSVIVPDVLITAHSASLGLAYYDGEMFPEEFRGDLFCAFHGSWNRSRRTGYKIVRVPMTDGVPDGGYENFAVGWLPEETSPTVWGRPVMVTVAPDGALLVVDDTGLKVWRISYGE